MAASPEAPERYFRRTSIFWMGLIISAMTYYGFAVFLPSVMPYHNLGLLGHVTKYLIDNHPKLLYSGFWIVWSIHVTEALYTIKLCKTKGITDNSVRYQWFIQTCAFGMASLFHLLIYKPSPKKQR
ncbi:transmembrane protein 254 [Carettochelys insculpta]|uniref:transmembrane protein 254 n=1 Tax=Carettochelys insculpta TaxID=44489 RepID=UPI003EB9622E